MSHSEGIVTVATFAATAITVANSTTTTTSIVAQAAHAPAAVPTYPFGGAMYSLGSQLSPELASQPSLYIYALIPLLLILGVLGIVGGWLVYYNLKSLYLRRHSATPITRQQRI